jgi:hypothetical protein
MVLCDGVVELILVHKRFRYGRTPRYIGGDWFQEDNDCLEVELVERGNLLLDVLSSVALRGGPDDSFLDRLCTKEDKNSPGLFRVDQKAKKELEDYLSGSLVSLTLCLSYCFAKGIGRYPKKCLDSIASIEIREDRGTVTATRMRHFVDFFFDHINPKLGKPVKRTDLDHKRIMVGYQYPRKGEAIKHGLFSNAWSGQDPVKFCCTERRNRIWLPHFLALGMCVENVLDYGLTSRKEKHCIDKEEFEVVASCYTKGGRYESIVLF